MPILDVNLEIYGALQTAIEAEFADNTDIAADARIYWTGIGGTASPGKNVTTEGDYPQLTLRGATTGGSDLHTGDETFGTYSDTNSPDDWLETSTWNYEIEIVSQGLGEEQYSGLCARAVNAVRKAGPRLGLDWVTRVRYTFTVSNPDSPTTDTDEDGVARIVSKISIAVQTQIFGGQLTGE